MTEKDKTTDAPSSEAVPDGEIIEVMSNAIAVKDCEMRRSLDIRRVFSNRIAKAALSALRNHFHVTITRKE